MPNKLINETSPYLLQHAHNPVDWYPWGDEAIQRARTEDKPMLVSIGYSACHWCHVMERESFEDLETAEIMNRLFVNIKIDREERPDLDHIYMDAVQAIAGNGGWPLNVFLTPEGKPFYGGTYFPPVSMHNRPSWKSVLQHIASAFRDKREEINLQADHLTNHIAGTGLKLDKTPTDLNLDLDDTEIFTKAELEEMVDQLMKTADRRDGGFGGAPKFPQTFSIRLLLQHHYYSQFIVHPDNDKTPTALTHALLSLDKMIYGGIYDQLGGGFARYSTDEEWLAPHFEKMLYDNALIIIAMSEAYATTGLPRYPKAIRETMAFLKREMRSGEGGFYAALDADSEGVEGKFYIWQKNDIDRILGEESAACCSFYDVTERGNWEGNNILRILDPGMLPPAEKEQEWKDKLLKEREKRIRPQLDDKILLGWNALMITACCKAFAALGENDFRDQAIRTMQFLEEKMSGEGIFHFSHSYKEGKSDPEKN